MQCNAGKAHEGRWRTGGEEIHSPPPVAGISRFNGREVATTWGRAATLIARGPIVVSRVYSLFLCLWQNAQCPVTAALIVWWNEPRLIYCKQHWWNRFADIATFGSRSIGDKIDEIMQYIQTIFIYKSKCLCFFYSYFHCLTGCLWTDTSLFFILRR